MYVLAELVDIEGDGGVDSAGTLGKGRTMGWGLYLYSERWQGRGCRDGDRLRYCLQDICWVGSWASKVLTDHSLELLRKSTA